jgi:glycosyltransferase involved in cell wall biosynthesis
MQAATRVITNSYFNRESLYRIYGVAPYVSYHGVDIQLFRPLGLERQPYVISVGAVRPDKGYDFLIQSLAYIPQKDRPRLILVGNTSLEPEIRYLQILAEQFDVQVSLGQQGRDFVEEQWTWERAIQSLEVHMEATVDHIRST